MAVTLGDIQGQLQAAIREQLKREVAVLKRLIDERRRGHTEPATDEQLVSFADFKKRWEAILEEGRETGFIVDDYDGPCLDEPRGEWAWDETEEEFQQRLNRENCDIGSRGHVVFPVAKGPRP